MSEVASVPDLKAQLERKTTEKRHICVETGIYRHVREKTCHERPVVAGKRTWRSLGVSFAPQNNLNGARDEYRRRRVMESKGRDPYSERRPQKKVRLATTVGELIRRYQDDGYLDAHLANDAHEKMLEFDPGDW